MISFASLTLVILAVCVHSLVALVTEAEARRVLGLSLAAKRTDIKNAYRKLVLEYHPHTRPPEERMQATNKIKLLKDAYDVLIEAPEVEDERPAKKPGKKEDDEKEKVTVDIKDIKESEKLKDPTAKEIIQDIQTLIAITGKLVNLLPTEVSPKNEQVTKLLGKDVKIPVKKFLFPLVNSFANIAELILGVIRYDEELKNPLMANTRCMYYSDKELKDAARTSNRAVKKDGEFSLENFSIDQCVLAGCPSKAACAANFVSRSTRTFKVVLFDNLVGKYNATTEKVEAGLFLNLLQAGNEFLNFILTFKPIKDKIDKSNWKDTAEKTPLRLKAAGDIGIALTSVASRALEALEIGSVLLGGKDALRTMSPELKAAGEQMLQQEREVPSFTDEQLEEMAAGGTDLWGDID